MKKGFSKEHVQGAVQLTAAAALGDAAEGFNEQKRRYLARAMDWLILNLDGCVPAGCAPALQPRACSTHCQELERLALTPLAAVFCAGRTCPRRSRRRPPRRRRARARAAPRARAAAAAVARETRRRLRLISRQTNPRRRGRRETMMGLWRRSRWLLVWPRTTWLLWCTPVRLITFCPRGV
jgi:hypothetical protein